MNLTTRLERNIAKANKRREKAQRAMEKFMKTKQAELMICGKRYSGTIYRHEYINGGGAALQMRDGEGVIATLTVNVVGYEPPTPNHVVVKDYSENTGVYDQMVQAGLVRGTGERVQTGWVTCPVAEIIATELRA